MIEEFNRSKLVSRTYLSQLPLVCTLLDDDECNDFLPESFFQILNRLIDMLLSGLLRFRNQLKSPGESSVAAEDQPFDMSAYTIATLDM